MQLNITMQLLDKIHSFATVFIQCISIVLSKIMFDFQDLVEDFIFPASKLIIEARSGSGKDN